MTAFWIFGAALAALALVLLLRPFLRSRKSEKIGRADANISIYRDHLRELDVDLAEGKLTAADHARSRAELDARLLADVAAPEAQIPAARPDGRRLALILIAVVPLFSAALYQAVRDASDVTGRAVGVLADLQGPKIRLGEFPSGPVQLEPGAEFEITTRPRPGDARGASTTYADLARDVRSGDTMLIDDGLVRLEVLATDGDTVRARVIEGGPVSSHKGINLPGVRISEHWPLMAKMMVSFVSSSVSWTAVSVIVRLR